MAEFNEMLQRYVDMEYDELVGMSEIALPDVLEACKVVDPDNEGFFMLTSVLLSAVGADKVLSVKERQFLRDVALLTDDSIDRLIGMYDSRMAELTDKFVDAMPDDLMAKTTILMMCLLACDGTITGEENAFIRKIISRA